MTLEMSSLSISGYCCSNNCFTRSSCIVRGGGSAQGLFVPHPHACARCARRDCGWKRPGWRWARRADLQPDTLRERGSQVGYRMASRRTGSAGTMSYRWADDGMSGAFSISTQRPANTAEVRTACGCAACARVRAPRIAHAFSCFDFLS